jgi:6-pyruvoyl-tetrahydropterin synthase
MARLFVEQLCALDCARLDGDLGLLGDTWLLDVELEGTLDDQGMVFDFGYVKPAIKKVVDTAVDHRLLVPRRHPGLRVEEGVRGLELWFACGERTIYHRSPPEAVCFLEAETVSSDAVSRHLQSQISPVLPDNVTRLSLGLREEQISGPWYRYVHGLRRHHGNCQHIAHGHRSRIEILRNGRRCEATERWLADRWRDIYLGSRSDLVEETEHHGARYYKFSYRAHQGEFELHIDADRCELLDAESTVECIAEYILGLLKSRDGDVTYQVRAYEGVNKGAIASG